jgi:hypothetical protein
MRGMLRAFGICAMVLCAFGAVAAAGASAAKFQTNEEAGALTGHALSPQTFSFSAGQVKCTTATTGGSAEGYEAEEQKVAVVYGGCTGFGLGGATVSTAEYELHANGLVDVVNTITIAIPLAGCSLTIGPQKSLPAFGYRNSGSKLITEGLLAGIAYSSSGGSCGPGGSNGTYGGSNELELNEGLGFVNFAPGGTLSKKVFQKKAEVKPAECTFAKVGDTCQIEFKVTGAGEGWKVENNEWKGEKAKERYKATVGCTAGKQLKNAETCTDEIEMIKKEEKTTNEWCVLWEPVEGAINKVPFCTKLKM